MTGTIVYEQTMGIRSTGSHTSALHVQRRRPRSPAETLTTHTPLIPFVPFARITFGSPRVAFARHTNGTVSLQCFPHAVKDSCQERRCLHFNTCVPSHRCATSGATGMNVSMHAFAPLRTIHLIKPTVHRRADDGRTCQIGLRWVVYRPVPNFCQFNCFLLSSAEWGII
jgi:hypothetical protein